MTNFKEHDGMLFKMLEEPTPLTPDAKMPCLVRLIQDDSPMGKHNKDLHAFDPGRLTPKICTEVIDVNNLSDPNRGSAICDGFMSIQYYRYELIGTFVKDGSKDWALYQIGYGNKVAKEGYGERYGSSFYENRLFYLNGCGCLVTKNGIGLIDPCSEDEFLSLDETGWQLYKESEPAKEPIADCSSCRHSCTNSNIDYCQMYEPTFKVGDWVTDGVVVGPVAVINEGKAWVKTKDAQYHISVEHLRKLDPSEVGDWVEFIDVGGRKSQGKYLSNTDGNAIIVLDITCNMRVVVPTTKIIRKLSPREVIVYIGCLSGTVSPVSNNGIHLWFHLIGVDDKTIATIRIGCLDKETRKLVEGLLKAQEEKK